ncbi:hypothetical protein KAR91_51520, partial [Candidatus Pacearchaeota archaeon]|nr:hypothetical protein [Candidatus Pacearchaeota archaeon]
LMCIRSHGGDGDSSQNPFIEGEPIKGLDYGILNQWEQWFAEMDNNGIVIFFIFYDDSAKIWDTGDAVGPEESDFIEGIVNEFEHHKNIIWVIAEEYTEAYTTIRVSNIASKIRASDDHDHVIAVHKTTGLSFSEFADDPNIDQFAIQYHGNASVLHNAMITAWNNANGKYNLNLAESGEHGTGEELRKKNWAIAMGGAYIMVYQMDIVNTEVSDLQGCGYLVDFFESTSVNEMEPRDDLAFGGTEYVLAYPENSYIAYASSLVGDIGLKNMAAGTYDFKWYDAADGTTVIQEGIDVASGDRTWSKPVIIGNELAVYVNRTGDLQQERVFPGVTWEFKMPTEVGLNSSKLDEFINNLGGRGSIVRHGYMVQTWGDQAFNHEWKSSSKPVFSTMLFFAIKEGKVASVDELITDWGWDLIPKDQMMTFSHLANMVSGYARGEEPGAAYAYNDYAIQLYGETLFERVFNEETPNAVVTAATRLGALEFEDGSIMLENYRVVASVRDFARICWFWLNKGNWNDEQLLSTSFFNDYMKPWVADDLPRTTEAGSDYLGIGTFGGGVDQDYPGQGIYGFNWWFNPNQSAWPDAPEDMIVTFGYGGNNCIIIPSLDLIVVADGNWGSFDPGNPEAGWNQNLKLLMQAVN